MLHEGLVHKPKRKPNGITKADKEARKSDDLLKRDFISDKPIHHCLHSLMSVMLFAWLINTLFTLKSMFSIIVG